MENREPRRIAFGDSRRYPYLDRRLIRKISGVCLSPVERTVANVSYPVDP
jgi:hypothetical protein